MIPDTKMMFTEGIKAKVVIIWNSGNFYKKEGSGALLFVSLDVMLRLQASAEKDYEI